MIYMRAPCTLGFRRRVEGRGLGIRGERKSPKPKLSHVNAHGRVRGVWCLLKLALNPLVTLVFRYGRNTASKDDGQSNGASNRGADTRPESET